MTPSTSKSPPRADATYAASAAAALGIVDAMVFRRVDERVWAHLGGIGRGEAWAGLVTIDTVEDACAATIPQQVGSVHLQQHAEPSRILGPYYAVAGATVRISNDIAVVFGNPSAPFRHADDATLVQTAQLMSAEIDDVRPAKRLADEIEILSAVRNVLDTPVDQGIETATKHLLDISITALTCEIGVYRSREGVISALGADHIGTETWNVILDEFALGGTVRCADDRDTTPSPTLLRTLPEAVACLAVPVPEPLGGTLLFIHTAANPRGYSLQCRRLVDTIIEASNIIIRSVVMYEKLQHAATKAAADARTDPLTGLGNRLAWDEALVHAQERVDAGEVYSVVSVDVDGLKRVNDELGHAAGDDLLRRCAAIIVRHCSDRDIPVRMGGDEFAVLVPHALDDEADTYVAFRKELSGPESTADTVAASIGVRTISPGGSLFDAIREADLQMYENKRARRRAHR